VAKWRVRQPPLRQETLARFAGLPHFLAQAAELCGETRAAGEIADRIDDALDGRISQRVRELTYGVVRCSERVHVSPFSVACRSRRASQGGVGPPAQINSQSRQNSFQWISRPPSNS